MSICGSTRTEPIDEIYGDGMYFCNDCLKPFDESTPKQQQPVESTDNTLNYRIFHDGEGYLIFRNGECLMQYAGSMPYADGDMRQSLTTKEDLENLRNELLGKITHLEQRISCLEGELYSFKEEFKSASEREAGVSSGSII